MLKNFEERPTHGMEMQRGNKLMVQNTDFELFKGKTITNER